MQKEIRIRYSFYVIKLCVCVCVQWRTEGRGLGGFKIPPPEIPKISVETSIA